MTSTATMSQLRRAIRDFDFTTLFIEELSWDRFRVAPLTVTAGGEQFTLRPVAQKRDVAVLLCDPNAEGGIPDYATRKKIDAEVRKQYHEHLIIYHDAGKTHQIWQWVRRQQGRPAAYREEKYFAGQSGERLAQRLSQLYIDLLDEETLTLTDVAARMQAFDVDRVTKRFYDRFKAEHDAFRKEITGIASEDDHDWYTSLMLNRLMFSYFIQRQGFLDGKTDYLRRKLAETQARLGPNKYHTFYREFLRRFFHDGLGAPESTRTPEIRALIGNIPYLNGGLFEVHQIESKNPNIAITDDAFARIFEFFDDYSWHLDDRPMKDDKEINPDVLGYIFEKYINQKQMGAYYTKEDITGYISRNTILPFIFEAARKECRIAFEPEGEVWRLLRDDPDRYIYDAVRRGVDLAMPTEIAAGIDDVARRGGWNRPADADFALPTETWREYAARRARCHDLRAKLEKGEIHEINDLITYNLDIIQFAQDVIEHCEGPELLRAIWRALTTVTVLDPTCGSGAFLFAALRLLEPLYEACLLRMVSFVGDFDRTGQSQKGGDFREVLARVKDHPNQSYFIRKEIILNNLYGVDIMEEAVEIAKLRLFLTLVSQVNESRNLEPLPDIDFNIRAGNTLVGFTTLDAVREAMMYGPNGQMRMLSAEDEATLASVDERAEIASRAYQKFQRMQSEHRLDAAAFRGAKVELRQRLADLRGELDHYLAREYGISATDDLFKFEPWRESHQPFHWFVEFYAIVHERGGFDVIIGNPPYAELRSITSYSVRNLRTVATKNLYPLVIERCLLLSEKEGQLGFIVPVSSISTEGYGILQEVIAPYSSHFSSFDDRPSRLFDGLEHIQLTVHLIQHGKANQEGVWSTECVRWNVNERDDLFSKLHYAKIDSRSFLPRSVPKIGSPTEAEILHKVWSDGKQIGEQIQNTGNHVVYYSRKVHNFLQALDFVPLVYDGTGKTRPPSELKEIRFADAEYAAAVFCLLNSSLFRWFINVFSDCRHVNRREVEGFRLDLANAARRQGANWLGTAESLSQSLQKTAEFRNMSFHHDTLRVQCIIPKHSKPIIDEIDRVLARHYGFSDEELDFIINYDIKYRMGADNGDEGNGNGEE